MKPKKALVKPLILGLAVLVVIVLLIILLLPRAMISTPFQVVEGNTITSDADIIVTVRYETDDVTEQVDPAVLVDILSRYSYRLISGRGRGSYLTGDTWSIDLIQGGKPIHIVVKPGEAPYWYGLSAFRYKLIGADSLWQELCDAAGLPTE